ncbi:hypothetical protein [Xylanimonas protaetiae]|uniref:Uncharacterized protein n=1 Tax=Xylanimonas protaetiae TaxID=2509457 RepID=A0A4P6FKM1_9MICO|nr:hypothetical protein [Xylanimonas protaetiae]QAY71178.1 hypothetical protein ET471_14965 [Xylanimonas protaetiae]
MTLLAHPLTAAAVDLADPAPAAARPYVAPRLELVTCPRLLTAYDGFVVSGRASGSELDGIDVEVSVAGVTRQGHLRDGIWSVRFEDGALSLRHAGVRSVTARVTDAWFNTAQTSAWVTIDEFEDGYVHVDARHDVVGGLGADGSLTCSGELGLGTHDQGRELVVVLVRDDTEAVVVSTGRVQAGWRHGEWAAALPLAGVAPGRYRVRALLTDASHPSLVRVAAGRPFTLA